MSKGYWVVSHLSTDESVLPAYAAAARPPIEAAGGRLIFRGKPARVHESGVNDFTVVVEFPSLEKAIAAYESPAYQAAVKVIEGTVKRDVRIVEGA